MKLYATITSERATKGQGGKNIAIEVTNEMRETIALINFYPENEARITLREDVEYDLDEVSKQAIEERVKGTKKGNKQTDDSCMYEHPHPGTCISHD